MWKELVAAGDVHRAVGLFEHYAGLQPVKRTPKAEQYTVAYRLIAAVLTLSLASVMGPLFRQWHGTTCGCP